MAKCDNCGGDGEVEVDCPDCQGEGCDQCAESGTIEVECDYCDGTGEVDDDDEGDE